MVEGEEPCKAEQVCADVSRTALPGSLDGSERTTGAAVLTPPKCLPADRVQAARASAAALAASAVRVGYVAAALARAGNRHGYPQAASSLGTSTHTSTDHRNYGVAAAAVRLAAAHASSTAPDDSNESRPLRRSLQAEVDSAIEEREVAEETAEADQPLHEESAARQEEDEEEQEEDAAEAAGASAVAEIFSSKPIAWEPNASDRSLGTIVVPAVDGHGAASSDEAAAGVWDVVVEKTFISVVPRRQVLPHTASAPGCLGIHGEAGRAVGRPRRNRSSRRRSRRRRASGEQAAAG